MARARSAFDDRHPPDPAQLDRCVHCGFCLPACPTYVLWGKEADSPRGRIHLMKAAARGELELTPAFVEHFDACLGCVSCSSACPSGVDYGQLIEATRAQIERRHPRAPGDRRFRAALFAVITRPLVLRFAALLLRLSRRLGLQAWLQRSALRARLPARLRALVDLAPEAQPPARIAAVTPAVGPRRRRVGLVLGCVQRELYSELNAATVRVLAAEGCEVVTPDEQPCCGALLLHAGEEPRALAHARRMIDAFEQVSVDCIVSNAAGCGSSLKEYGQLLRDDPEYAARARRFSERCRDVSELLTELEPRSPRQPLPLRVAMHDACHLRHAQNVHAQPRALLAGIPQLALCELPEGALCCGSAGIYNLLQPETAQQLAERKADHILAAAPDVVATGNIGCMLQLSAALRRRGSPLRVLHTVELLDASLRGDPLPGRRGSRLQAPDYGSELTGKAR